MMNDWLRVTAIGGDDYECRMTVLKADDTTITITLILFWRESRVTFSVADESPQPVAARLCSVRLRFRCFFPRFRNSIPQTIACDASPSSNA